MCFESQTCVAGRWHGGHQVWSSEMLHCRQREEVDRVANGMVKHNMQDLHR